MMRVSALVLILLVGAPALGEDRPLRAGNDLRKFDKQIGELVDALPKPSWKVRQRASLILVLVGSSVQPVLQKVLEGSKSPEQKRRLEEVLSEDYRREG